MAACLAGMIMLVPQIGWAQSDGPFGDIEGSWKGTGRVVGTDGKNERIRCRASYSVSPSGSNLSQSLVCASDSYRFNIRSNIISQGGNIEGTWQETTRNATGHVSGTASGGRIDTTVSGPGFTARLSLAINGNKQVVNIVPQGTDIAQVDIVMTR